MTTKICCTCGQEKPLAEFNIKRANKDGFERYCKECHRNRNKRHYDAKKQDYKDCARKWKQVKRDWWVEYKKTLSCTVCGEPRYWCLDFHHLDASKKEATISQLIGSNRSRERILAEAEKCVVVCRNCHADIHFKQNNGPLV